MRGIQLRPYRHGDEVDLQKHANSPRIATAVRDSFPFPYSLQDATRWIEFCLADPPQSAIHRSITLHDQVIGGIGAIRSPDIYRFNAEIGYWLGEDYWGLGYTTQALREFSDWLFAHTDLNRLFAGVFSFNNASMRVLIKAGFHPEAIHARAIYKNNQFWDEHYFVKFRDQSSVS